VPLHDFLKRVIKVVRLRGFGQPNDAFLLNT
jgi:hypothetical protein